MVAAIVAAALTVAGGAGAFAFSETEKRATTEAETRVRTTHDGLAAVRLDLLLPNPTTRTRGMKQAMHLLAAFDLPHDPHWQTKPAFQKVPAEQRAALSSDLGELLLLVANARLKEGKTADRAGSVNDARLLNELARGCFEDIPPPWLAKQRAELDGTTVEAAAAKSARDHFLDGASLYSQMKFDVAVRPLEKAVAGEPDHGAANFLLARCQHHVGNFEAAVERYKSAAALLPKDPRPVYFSGIALWLSDHHSSSEEAYSAAIELDDNYADAYIARGIANLEVQDYRNADRDFTKALERGAAKLQVHTLRAHARAGMNNAEGETEDRKVAAGLEAEDEQDFLTRGYTLFKTAPRKALADFQSAIEKNPDSLTARRNQVLILADELRDDAAALKAADELAKFFPQYSQGRAIRALVLARLGRRDEAIQEAAACRKLLTAKGPNFRDERVVYRLAVVHAVVARSAEERSDAIRILKEALRAGFSDFAGLENERDLASIRELPEFQLAVESAKELGN